MLALARLQRKMRLVESPYRTPQTLVGGPRSDAALAGLVGAHRDHQGHGQGLHAAPAPRADRGAEEAAGGMAGDVERALRAAARSSASSCGRGGRVGCVSSSGIYGDGEEKLANVIVDPIKDRHGRSILTVRDQNTFSEKLRQKRLMTLIHLWLVHRFKADAVYYVTPTEDNLYQTEKMKSHGIFSNVYQEVGEIIVADVNHERIDELLAPDREALGG